MGPNINDPLSAPIENVQKDLSVNTISAYAAAQEAVKGFEKLPNGVKKTFIYTGNAGNTCVSLPPPFQAPFSFQSLTTPDLAQRLPSHLHQNLHLEHHPNFGCCPLLPGKEVSLLLRRRTNSGGQGHEIYFWSCARGVFP